MRERWLAGAGLILASGAMATAPEAEPVTLVATPTGTAVTVDVVGRAATAQTVRYRLVLEGRSNGGTNRTVQSGDARLSPGEEKLLLRNRIGSVAGGGWRATLTVTLADREYQVEREGPGES